MKRKYKLTVPVGLDEETQYWLGFILADGCVMHPSFTPSLFKIALQKRDQYHLIMMLRWLQSDYPLYYDKKRKSYEWKTSRQDFVAWLESYGICERKSHIARADYRLIDSRDFWRGVIDGDGTIGLQGKNKQYARITLVGSQQVCQQFSEYLQRALGIQLRVCPHKNIFVIGTTGARGSNARRIIHHLYHKPWPVLNRKHSRYNDIVFS